MQLLGRHFRAHLAELFQTKAPGHLATKALPNLLLLRMNSATKIFRVQLIQVRKFQHVHQLVFDKDQAQFRHQPTVFEIPGLRVDFVPTVEMIRDWEWSSTYLRMRNGIIKTSVIAGVASCSGLING